MNTVEYVATDQVGLDAIESLWEGLNRLHAGQASPFAELYRKKTFTERKNELLEKAEGQQFLLHMALDSATRRPVGYCISMAKRDGYGEIESLYVEPEYRKLGIGDVLMKQAIAWMDGLEVARKKIVVYAGNEAVLGFYRRYGFEPRQIVLEQTE